jgi:hypothetical protein
MHKASDHRACAMKPLPDNLRKIVDQYHKLRASLPLDSPELVSQYIKVQEVLAKVAKGHLDEAIAAGIDPAYSGWFDPVPVARITRRPHKDYEKIRVIHDNTEPLWPRFKYTLSAEEADAWLAEPSAVNSWVSSPQLVCGFIGRVPMNGGIPLFRAVQTTTEDTIFTTNVVEYRSLLEQGYSYMGECGFVFPV